MTNQEILELMARFDASSLTAFKLHTKDTELEMDKGVAVMAAPAAPAAAPAVLAPAAPAPAPAAAPAAPAPEGKCITAPVVGTFYVAPAPDQPPFVQPGDKVQKGQTVCLMEAMKMMSEVKAPCDCVIEAVLQEDGTLVSFGDALIRYREG